MIDTIDLNGDFVICERVDSESLKNDSGVFIYNKENVPVYKITGKHLSENVDFPFKVGDKVSKGDTLCIIEAMKIMNEINSDFDGEIVEVLCNNEEMVEFGQPLFKIR